MATDVLKTAMLKYAPQLARDYKEFVKKIFKQMQGDLGLGLKGVYSSWKWARTYQGIRANISKKYPTGRGALSPSEYDKIPAVLNIDALNRNAKAYGERVALEWYNKMRLKLGKLSNVKVLYMPRGGDITVTGKYKGKTVTIDQQRIINVSSRGTLFHQFPSRIYVNGKFMSEANYKKQML